MLLFSREAEESPYRRHRRAPMEKVPPEEAEETPSGRQLRRERGWHATPGEARALQKRRPPFAEEPAPKKGGAPPAFRETGGPSDYILRLSAREPYLRSLRASSPPPTSRAPAPSPSSEAPPPPPLGGSILAGGAGGGGGAAPLGGGGGGRGGGGGGGPWGGGGVGRP